SDEVFRSLSRCLDQISEIVAAHEGIVDRSLGDGILCFFGYSRHKAWPNHAVAAFTAARKIQENMVLSTYRKTLPDDLIFPLRIGINTAEVTIG
ncbi:adenylate/guanylate cyclase domain-containing protein, partial [Pseudoalteromonas distincta]|uniref:adenylate/guanylate cyclase domain-containing protein n=1 Tax=Pseudoalteromonas distincta TaxID=77608 RepID=UPI0034E8C475